MTDPFTSRPSFERHLEPDLDWLQHEFCRFPESSDIEPPEGITERLKTLTNYFLTESRLPDSSLNERNLKNMISHISRKLESGEMTLYDLQAIAPTIREAIRAVQEDHLRSASSVSIESERDESRTSSPSLSRLAKVLSIESTLDSPLPPAKMVVIDDELVNGKSLARIVSRLPGLQARSAPTYYLTTSDFLEKCRTDPASKPDIIFLDHNLSSADTPSWDFLSQLRENPLLKDITVILATSDSVDGISPSMKELLDGYIQKGTYTSDSIKNDLLKVHKFLINESSDRTWLRNTS
jgi:CheY-like chemotaxis protein